jgi:cob(I)alamin adenosyltransferase
MTKIYTKTGDKGTSSLYNGNRICKDSIYFDVLGENDELSSRIGILYSMATPNLDLKGFCVKKVLRSIQSLLQDINSNIAKANTIIPEDSISEIESYIDIMDCHLPKLTKFILPGSYTLDAQAHMCRTQVRKVERALWKMNGSVLVDDIICKYMNRLSDFFFMLARWFCENKSCKNKYKLIEYSSYIYNYFFSDHLV